MSDPIRAALERLVHRLLNEGVSIASIEAWTAEADAALAAAPSAPDPHEALAVRPLLEAVAALEVYNGPLPALQQRISAWLVENPPGQPVAIEPRGCPAPGACSCVEPSAPDHLRGATEMAAHSARLRQCPTHGQQPAHTWGCPECLRELREELARVKATAADGDREELADRLGWIAAQLADIG